MSKRKPQPVAFKKKDDNIIRINMADIKARKPQPPTVQRHTVKTDYRRKPKHPNQEE